MSAPAMQRKAAETLEIEGCKPRIVLNGLQIPYHDRADTNPSPTRVAGGVLQTFPKASPGIYKFTGNNCTNLVRLTLQQGGISTPGQPGPRPYFDSLPGKP